MKRVPGHSPRVLLIPPPFISLRMSSSSILAPLELIFAAWAERAPSVEVGMA